MTEQRTMNSIIHAAFRRALRCFDGALAPFPAGSGEGAVQSKAAWDHLAYQLRLHHEDEEATSGLPCGSWAPTRRSSATSTASMWSCFRPCRGRT